MKNNWVQYGSTFLHKEIANQMPALPVAVYLIEEDEATKAVYLNQLEEKFSLPDKVYGIEASFIKRVIKTYHETKGNLGILMNGVKGTGKTLTAKQICNELGMPVLIVKKEIEELPTFLNSLQEDVVVFFDEYEKIYNEYDNDILTIMDGILTNDYRKVFLLTTNNPYVNENMLQRPGRIRYYKTFDDLSLEAITEVVEDRLVNKDFKEEVIKFIAGLEIITIDIVQAIVKEVNIHDDLPEAFKDIFNVRPIENIFDVYYLEDGKPTLRYAKSKISPAKVSKNDIRRKFVVNGENLGTIIEVVKDGYKVRSDYGRGTDEEKVVTYIMERGVGVHRNFTEYVF